MSFCTDVKLDPRPRGRTLRVLENGVQSKIFGPLREEIIGERRKLHNEKLHEL
jgi:hypothetical protein